MWRLDFKDGINDASWHRRYYLFSNSLLRKIILLKESNHKDIKVTPMGSIKNVESYMIWKVLYQECNNTKLRVSYFPNALETMIFIIILKKEHYKYYDISLVRLSSIL